MKTQKDDVEDMFYAAKRLENALKPLQKSEKLTQKDKKAIRDFVENLKARRVSVSRIGRYVYHLRTIGENLGTTFEAAKLKASLLCHYAFLEDKYSFTRRMEASL
jgi:seryl-tRNA synthetase